MRTFNFTLLAMLGYVAVVVGAIPLASGNLNRAPAAEAVDRLESSPCLPNLRINLSASSISQLSLT
ncbi:hypothetical protein BGY98DRAFT_1101138 [Russula aff. rugulosa BPL654]|nr:hypothetical protein BGY98DRAFT_1101138 [Russula aff. rugulosa BPL654]